MTESSNLVLLPSAYFPPISYYTSLLKREKVLIETMETYPKQTYRNRCEILTSSGKLNLIVPISKPNGNHTITKDIEISYREPWDQHHWKSIQTAYRSSPYFNYYADIFAPLFNLKEKFLINLNQAILKTTFQILRIKPEIAFTVDYIDSPEVYLDYRSTMKPGRINAKPLPSYPQVFSHLQGFQDNLSILDLIFNLGPEAREYLEKIPD